MKQWLPQFEFMLDDISHISDEALLARDAHELSQILPVVLWAMRDSRNTARLMRSLKSFAELLRRLWETPEGQAALLEVFRYISLVGKVTRDELIEVAAAAGPEARETAVTLAEYLGTEATRRMAQGVLQAVFGELPSYVVDRLKSADEAQLSTWLIRAYEVRSLEDVFS